MKRVDTKRAYAEGQRARKDGGNDWDNPYTTDMDPEKNEAWMNGFNEGRTEPDTPESLAGVR